MTLQTTIEQTINLPQSVDARFANVSGTVASPSWTAKANDYAQTLVRFSPTIIALGLTVLFAAFLLSIQDELAALGNWAYVSVFFAEMGSAAMIIIPTPSPAYTFSMGAVHNPVMVGLIGGIAATLGESTGYLVGVKSRHIMADSKLFGYLERASLRYGGRALFAFSMLPLPIDIAGFWAGSVRFSLWRFLVLIAPGKTIKVMGIALMGYYGVSFFGA